METLRAILTLILGLALVVSLTISWRTRREFGQMKQELHHVTDANDVLRKTLGDLTVAITQRQEEIDRLHSLPCKTPQDEQRDLGPLPRPRNPGGAKASSSTSIGAN
jgi:hypothetical protein